MLANSGVCAAQKQRFWTGPNDFVEGIPPEPRSGHGCALLNQRLFVFGGIQLRTGITQSFYEFDIDFLAWTNLSTLDTQGPPSLAFLGMASSRDAIYLFGGNDKMNSMRPLYIASSLHIKILTQSWIFSQLRVSCQKSSLSRAGILNDLYRFDINSMKWTSLDARSPPAPRFSHGLAFAAGSLYVFGGMSADFEVLGDLHQLELGTSAWQLIGANDTSAPSARFHAGIVTAADAIYVFGGLSDRFGEHQYSAVETSLCLIREIS